MYAVITENDESPWEDQTGVAYHFPQRYVELLKPGTRVVYYKGSLKNRSLLPRRMMAEPHYFGIAEIGRVHPDRNSLKGDKFAVIEGYRPFVNPVPIRHAGEYVEHIPQNRLSNYWRDGVRRIDRETYERIISLARGLHVAGDASSAGDANPGEDAHDALESLVEGNRRMKYVAYYERNPRLRKLALLIHGYDCKGCGFNFEKAYGERGSGFIHVHHLVPVSEYEGAREVNPETEMTVLCPNCHAMVHRVKEKTLSLEELKTLVSSNRAQAAR